MSVYHKWKCVFIQIPKNATTSIHNLLQNMTDNEHDHKTYIDVIQSNDLELIETYYSFSCIRNPYDRLVSAYEYENPDGNVEITDPSYSKKDVFKNFHDFVRRLYEKRYTIKTDYNDLYYEQYKFITIKDIMLVDDIIKIENLEDDWKLVLKNINKNITKYKLIGSLPHENITERKINNKWEEYYTDEIKELAY